MFQWDEPFAYADGALAGDGNWVVLSGLYNSGNIVSQVLRSTFDLISGNRDPVDLLPVDLTLPFTFRAYMKVGAAINATSLYGHGFNDLVSSVAIVACTPHLSGTAGTNAGVELNWALNGDSDGSFVGGLACALNATHTVDLKFDGSDLLAYLDGVLVTSVPITESMAGLESLTYVLFYIGAAAVGPMIDRLVFDQPPAF